MRLIAWLRTGGAWLIARVVLAGVFVAAAIPKIAAPATFAHAIYNYKLLPGWAVTPVALFLPWLELACAVALVIGRRWRLGASFLVLLMMTVFTAGVVSALLRGLNIECGCFGTGAPATWWTAGRDALLLALSAAVFVRSAREEGVCTSRI